jgi:hypothetical protein
MTKYRFRVKYEEITDTDILNTAPFFSKEN